MQLGRRFFCTPLPAADYVQLCYQSLRRIPRYRYCGHRALLGVLHLDGSRRTTAFLRHLGRSVHQSADEQDKHAVYSWPRVAAKCDYQGSPSFEDEVTIVMTISRIGSTSVTYQFVFQCDGQPIAQGEMTAVHCLIRQGEKPKPKPIPDDLRDQLNEYLA